MATAIQLGYELCKPLVEAGLVPAKTTRLSIDVTPDEIVTATFATHADQKLLDAIWPHLENAKWRRLYVTPNTAGGYTVELEERRKPWPESPWPNATAQDDMMGASEMASVLHSWKKQ